MSKYGTDSVSEAKKAAAEEINKRVSQALKEARRGDFSLPEGEKPKDKPKPVHELGKALFEETINLASLQDWRDEHGMPVKCLLDVYKATGILEEAKAFKERTGLSVIAGMQIVCSRRTFEILKDFITTNWEWWPIDLISDEKVIWLPGWEHKPRKFPHKIKARVRNSLHADFAATAYAPLMDDSINGSDDDMKISFHDREPTEAEKTEAEGKPKEELK